jgi:hypothetical protein
MDETPIEQAAAALAGRKRYSLRQVRGWGWIRDCRTFVSQKDSGSRYPAYRHLRLRFSQLANPRWFLEDPALA